MAYAGLLRGHATVAEAMDDAPLIAFVTALVADEVLPAVGSVTGLDLPAYADSVFDRFRNPSIVHRLAQIAQDGSQKLPYRLGDTIAFHRAAGRLPSRALRALGLWLAFARTQPTLTDPCAGRIADAVRGDYADAARMLAREGIGLQPRLADDEASLAVIAAAADAASRGDWSELLS